jgi:hypothetical protein
LDKVCHLAPKSFKIESIERISPEASLILTPTLSKASEYLFKSVPSSKVSPRFNPSIRANKVLKAVPTTSAL